MNRTLADFEAAQQQQAAINAILLRGGRTMSSSSFGDFDCLNSI
ncbi:unnamed protein product [Brassica oleracea]